VGKLEYTFKTDTLFKMLFVKNNDLLKQLVSELLEIRLESIGEFQITNPEMPPDIIGGKFCRLDILMTVRRTGKDKINGGTCNGTGNKSVSPDNGGS